MSKKRILIAVPTVTSYRLFLHELLQALGSRGWEVHLACSLAPIPGFDCYAEPIAGQAHAIDFPRGASPLGHWRAGRQLAALVAAIRPDVLHCHFSVTAFTAAVARRRGWPPTIATIQGLMFPQATGWRRWVFGAAEAFACRRMDATWVLTQSDVDALARLGLRRRVCLQQSSGFGCRLDQFSRERYSPAEVLALRESTGIGENDFVFAFVGRQVHFKGFALVVRAFLALARTHARARLLLVGQRDPLHPTGLNPAEEKALAQSPQVIAVGWQADTARYFALAHLNVFPSKREGIPVNLMESLAMGVPVITMDSRGCRDVVRDGVDGLVIARDDEPTLRAAMERMLGDEKLRREFARNAQAGRSRFDRNAWIEEQIGIYEGMLAPGAGHRP